MRNLTIGEASKRTDCKIETIRFYEKEGLLPRAARTKGGHRTYGESLINRITFIRRSRDLGFPIGDVRKLLATMDHDVSCADVRQITDQHIEKITEKIEDLSQLKQTLMQLASRCSENASPGCPFVDALRSAWPHPRAS